jgi:hypothetical protein
LPAFKQRLCGTAAPILLRSIGSDTRVEIDPPATVTCELAKALSNWILDEVQPEAMALLDSPVVKLRASSYACRNCYNRSNGHLSEHALANAFDLSEFVLASGQHITIRDDWNSRFLALPLRNSLHVINVSASSQTVAPPLSRGSQFARNAHQSAWQMFGTVLGPAANRAHKDHFSLRHEATTHQPLPIIERVARPPDFREWHIFKVTPVGTGPALGYAATHKQQELGGCNAGTATPQRALYARLERAGA